MMWMKTDPGIMLGRYLFVLLSFFLPFFFPVSCSEEPCHADQGENFML